MVISLSTDFVFPDPLSLIIRGRGINNLNLKEAENEH